MANHDFITISKSAKDLTGQRFGRLSVLGPIDRDKFSNIIWLCLCDCGKYSHSIRGSLISGSSESCGCLQSELVSSRFTTHGLTSHPLYFVWKDILKRCLNPLSKPYPRYGGRGISVFPDWINSLEKFISYASSLPDYGMPNLTLDRTDNDGNYEPENLRWVTRTKQARNTRRNHLLTYKNETKCIAEWAEILGISTDVISKRLKSGWSVEKTLSTPILK